MLDLSPKVFSARVYENMNSAQRVTVKRGKKEDCYVTASFS